MNEKSQPNENISMDIQCRYGIVNFNNNWDIVTIPNSPNLKKLGLIAKNNHCEPF